MKNYSFFFELWFKPRPPERFVEKLLANSSYTKFAQFFDDIVLLLFATGIVTEVKKLGEIELIFKKK